jgi:hypothetical protein
MRAGEANAGGASGDHCDLAVQLVVDHLSS